MRANEVIWHDENVGVTWETSYRCCIRREDIRQEVTVGGRFYFFLEPGHSYILIPECNKAFTSKKPSSTE